MRNNTNHIVTVDVIDGNVSRFEVLFARNIFGRNALVTHQSAATQNEARYGQILNDLLGFYQCRGCRLGRRGYVTFKNNAVQFWINRRRTHVQNPLNGRIGQ